MNVHEDTEELKYDQSSIDQLENIDSKETISSSGDLSSDDEKQILDIEAIIEKKLNGDTGMYSLSSDNEDNHIMDN